MCGQRTSQFSKCEGNRRGKLRKLLDWRREWCVPSTLSHTDFIEKAAITYLPIWMLVENSSKLNMRRSTECTLRGAPIRYEQNSAGQGPRASLTILSNQIWHTTGGKKLLWSNRTKVVKCYLCILVAETGLLPDWGDSKVATALRKFLDSFTVLWVNGKKEEREEKGSFCVVLLHTRAKLTKLSSCKLTTALCRYNFYNAFLNYCCNSLCFYWPIWFKFKKKKSNNAITTLFLVDAFSFVDVKVL